jgi:glutamate formiminotransferase/formiminotetrahydrofolate cyclodeaminase
LIAYNVYLATDDVSIAKKIARAVRFSSGGLRYVKALGLLVDGRAQVSMNLTNFRETPVARVVEFIRREAERYGVGVHHSELVGLIPEEALVDAAVWHLQLDHFEPEQILERRLRAALTESDQRSIFTSKDRSSTVVSGQSLAPAQFLEALAGAEPAPGGGSASAYAGAVAAALVAMVARLTLGKKKYVDVHAQMQAVLEKAEALRQELARAIDEDAAAFERVIAAYKLPKGTPDEEQTRQATIQAALLDAANEPLKVACKSVEVMALAEIVVSHGNPNAISDGATAAVQARAALSGAGYNVRVNAAGLNDQTEVSRLLDELKRLEKQAADYERAVHAALISRGGMLV